MKLSLPVIKVFQPCNLVWKTTFAVFLVGILHFTNLQAQVVVSSHTLESSNDITLTGGLGYDAVFYVELTNNSGSVQNFSLDDFISTAASLSCAYVSYSSYTISLGSVAVTTGSSSDIINWSGSIPAWGTAYARFGFSFGELCCATGMPIAFTNNIGGSTTNVVFNTYPICNTIPEFTIEQCCGSKMVCFDDLSVTSGGSGEYTYKWYYSGVLSNNSTSLLWWESHDHCVTYKENGTYNVCLEIWDAITGCCDNFVCHTVVVTDAVTNMVLDMPISGNANDISGNNNHGTVVGASLVADRNGVANSAYWFDGVNDQIDIADNATLDLSDTYTIMAWVKPESGYGDFKDNHVAVISKWGNGGVGNAAYSLDIWTGGRLFSGVHHGGIGGTYLVSNGIVPDNGTWTHVAVTRSCDDSLRLYINGILDKTQYSVVPQNSTFPLTIGMEADPGIQAVYPTRYRYHGAIDEIKIYKCGLSLELIRANAGIDCSTSVTLSAIHPTCGQCNGSLTATASNGTPPYSFAWPYWFGSGNNTSTNTNTISGLCYEMYTVTITDAMGCTATATITLEPSSTTAPQANLTTTNTTCGQCNGSITSAVTGGTQGNHSFVWSNGATTQNLTGLCDGSYTVTITDANGCTATASTNVATSSPPVVSITGSQTICQGDCITITVTAPTGLTYQWSGDNTLFDDTPSIIVCPTPPVFGLVPIYTVTVTDAYGCTATASTTVIVNPLPVAAISGPSSFCIGSSATLTASGGTTYSWSNGGTASTKVVTTAGTYTVTVTNSFGCTATASKTITTEYCNPCGDCPIGAVNISTGINNSTGLAIPQGSPDDTWTLIAGPAGANLVANPNSGWANQMNGKSYWLGHGSGGNTGLYIYSHTIVVPPCMTAQLCIGWLGADDNINFSIDGVNVYSWVNSAFTNANAYRNPPITATLGAGTHTLIANINNTVSAGGFLLQGCYTLTPNTPISVSLQSTTTQCTNPCNGSITSAVAGGTPLYTYNWSNGATTQNLTGLCAGTYTVTVTDGNGCTATQTVAILPSVPLSVTISSLPNNCDFYVLTTDVAGGTTPYLYEWNNGETGQSLNVTSAGIYEVTVTDAMGCTATISTSLPNYEFCPPATFDLFNNGGLTISGTTPTLPSGYNVVNYHIDYGDGTGFDTATPMSFIHDYMASGTHTVCITVTIQTPFGQLCYCTYCQTITTTDPCSQLSALELFQSGGLEIAINPPFSNTYNIVHYSFNYGDGTPTLESDLPVSAIHTYLGNGTYTVCVTVTIQLPTGQLITCTVCKDALIGSCGLVPNYSFEEGNYPYPNAPNQIALTTHWFHPPSTSSSSDWYSNTFPGGYLLAGTTYNLMPHSGCKYGGFDLNTCEGLEVQLNQPINAGCTYNVDFWWTPRKTTTSNYEFWAVVGHNSCTTTGGGMCGHSCLGDMHVKVTVTPTHVPGTWYHFTSTYTNGVGAALNYVVFTGQMSVSPVNNYIYVDDVCFSLAPAPCEIQAVLDIPNVCFTVGEPIFFCNDDAYITGCSTQIIGNTWNFGDGTIVNQSYPFYSCPGHTYTTPGIYDVCLTVQGTNGIDTCSNTICQSISVNQPTMPVGQWIDMCANNGTINLLSCPIPADHCEWTLNGNPYSNSSVITPTISGDYLVKAYDANGCLIGEFFYHVEVHTVIATASSNSPVCMGNSINLSASGGVSYIWSGTGGYTSTIQNPTRNNATTAHAGTYTVTVTDAYGCTATASTTVIVNPLPVAAISGPSSFCVGSSATLTASGGITYLWSNGGTASTKVVTTAGTYTVTVTNSFGCTATASKTVTVSPLPTAAITGPSIICAGSSITLTATGSGTYLWGNGSTSSTRTVTVGGTYTITVTNVAGCTKTASKTVTVSPLPTAVITGPSTICSGSSATLTATGGSTYLWNNGSTSNTHTIATAGIYTVTVTNAAGCTATVSKTVNVVPLPTATATVNCTNNNATITVMATGVVPLSYSLNGGTYQSGNVFNGLMNGTYTITVRNGYGCTRTITVVVNCCGPLMQPTGLTTYINSSTSTILSWGAVQGACQYQIQYSKRNIFGSWGAWITLPSQNTTSVTISALQGGKTYRWRVKAICCNGTVSAWSNTKTFTLPYPSTISNNYAAKVNEDTENKELVSQSDTDSPLIVYPNPATKEVTIDYYTPTSRSVQIKIFDVAGKEAFSQTYNSTNNQNSVTLDTSTLTTGYYVIELSDGNSRKHAKLLIVK